MQKLNKISPTINLCGSSIVGGHEGKYIKDIQLNSCEFSYFESNSGNGLNYSKCLVQIEFHPNLTLR